MEGNSSKMTLSLGTAAAAPWQGYFSVVQPLPHLRKIMAGLDGLQGFFLLWEASMETSPCQREREETDHFNEKKKRASGVCV